MDSFQESSRAQFKRVAAFGRENAALFEPRDGQLGPTRGQNLLIELDVLIVDIDETSGLRGDGVPEAATRSKLVVRDLLSQDLSTIAASVRFHAKDKDLPGLSPQFRLLKVSSDEQLIERAVAFADAIERFSLEPELISMGHETGLVTALRRRVETFRKLIQTRHQAHLERVDATSHLDDLFARGRLIVSGLDAAVRARARGTPKHLAAWKSASHLTRPTPKAKAKADAQAVLKSEKEAKPKKKGGKKAAPAPAAGALHGPAPALPAEPRPPVLPALEREPAASSKGARALV